jgi:hypothetical protein
VKYWTIFFVFDLKFHEYYIYRSKMIYVFLKEIKDEKWSSNFYYHVLSGHNFFNFFISNYYKVGIKISLTWFSLEIHKSFLTGKCNIREIWDQRRKILFKISLQSSFPATIFQVSLYLTIIKWVSNYLLYNSL